MRTSDRGVLALRQQVAIFVPHLIVDDGRLVRLYMKRVKKCSDPPPDRLMLMVDQSTHLICLWAAALLAAALS